MLPEIVTVVLKGYTMKKTYSGLSAAREEQDAIFAQETALLRALTVEESLRQWLILQVTFEEQLRQTAVLFESERRDALKNLQDRLLKLNEVVDGS